MSRSIHSGETYGNTIKSKLENGSKNSFVMLVERESTPQSSISKFFNALQIVSNSEEDKIPGILLMNGVGIVVRDKFDNDVDENHLYDIYWFKADNKKIYFSNIKGSDNAKVGVLIIG